MIRISNITFFLYLCSMFSLITISTCNSQRSIEFTNYANGKVDQIKVLTPSANALAKLGEHEKEKYKSSSQDDYSFMSGITDCIHVLMVMISPEIKVHMKDRKDRPRETMIKKFYGWLEEASGNKLKVFSFYSLNLYQIRFLYDYMFQMFKQHWHNYNGKEVYLCLSTMGLGKWNFPIYQIADDVQFRLAIYENPYIRYYFENIENESFLEFTYEMASEYPVPLPYLVHQSEQQKQFQIYTNVELLHQKQNELVEFIKHKRIPHFECVSARARLIPAMEKAKQDFDKIKQSKFELIIDDFSGDDPKRIEMNFYKTKLNHDAIYIPDPDFKDWTYLKDTTSKKFAHLIMMPNVIRQSIDNQYNGAKKSEIYNFIKIIKRVSKIVEPTIIYVKGYNFGAAREVGFHRLFRYWIDYHRQKADKRDPIEYVLTTGFAQVIEHFFDIIDRPYALYECPYLRYAIDHITDGYWLKLIDNYAKPVQTPADAWNDLSQKRLQNDLKTEVESLQDALKKKIQEMIENGEKIDLYKDSKNVEGGSKRAGREKEREAYRFTDLTEKTRLQYKEAQQTGGTLPAPQFSGFVDDTETTAQEYLDKQKLSIPTRSRKRVENVDETGTKHFEFVDEQKIASGVVGELLTPQFRSSGQSEIIGIVDETDGTKRDHNIPLKKRIRNDFRQKPEHKENFVALTKPQGEQGISKTPSPLRASDQTQRPNDPEKSLRAHPRDSPESHYGDGVSSGKKSRRE